MGDLQENVSEYMHSNPNGTIEVWEQYHLGNSNPPIVGPAYTLTVWAARLNHAADNERTSWVDDLPSAAKTWHLARPTAWKDERWRQAKAQASALGL